MCNQAEGRVLEVAVGTGLNLPPYSADVDLTGVDMSPAMLDRARDRAEALGRDIDLREGDAHALHFADASYDTVGVHFADASYDTVVCTCRCATSPTTTRPRRDAPGP